MKYIFIVVFIKCVDLINGEWRQVFREHFNHNLDNKVWNISQSGEI